MSRIEPKGVKHTPLKQTEKFWEDVPSTSKTPNVGANNDVAELLKIIITKLDKIISKLDD
jgi:hypothetical protein